MGSERGVAQKPTGEILGGASIHSLVRKAGREVGVGQRVISFLLARTGVCRA